MIRTRDFLIFCLAFVFLLTGISATVFNNSWHQGGQVAAVAKFAEGAEINGAIAEVNNINRDDNIARLRSKVASGEGDISAGGPIFTSVDDVVLTTSTPMVTDQTVPASIQIGHTMDGVPLMNSELWRFIGFSETEQIGVALNGVPLFGSRTDTSSLDACGGANYGFGYQLYLRPNANIAVSCFISAR